MTNVQRFDQNVIYEIRISGVLDATWMDWFGGLTMEYQGNETLLIGEVIDQGALLGLLNKIQNLGLLILSVEWQESGGLSR